MIDPQSFIGRQEAAVDFADPARFLRLAATLDDPTSPWAPGFLRPLGHWLCFRPDARMSMLGPDGHPQRTGDGLLPNAGLPRRMWAGSRVSFHTDIPLGANIRRTSTLISATPKQGRSGNMLLLTVRHEIYVVGSERAALIEEQDIVYRSATRPAASPVVMSDPVGRPGEIVDTITLDPVTLFRYSALTFNSHRIHYDRDYARDVEGYRGLVVHGPLLATVLMDHFARHRPACRVSYFSFRAISPAFDNEPIRLGLTSCEMTAQLRAIGPAGVTMTADVHL